MRRYFRILILSMVLCSVLVGCNIGEDKVMDVIFPAYLINISGFSPEENKQNIEEENFNNKWCNDILVNEDGSITLKVTDNQIKNWIENITSKLEEKKKSYIDQGVEINFNKDFSKIEYIMDRDTPVVSFAAANVYALSISIQYQMFSGVDPNDWSIDVAIIDSKNNKILAECTLPGEIFSIPSENWE